MSQELVIIWLVLVMCISIPTIFAGGFMAMRHPLLDYLTNSFCAKVFKIGVYFAMLGLCVQTYRSLYFFQFEHYPADVFFPTWVTKDLGICLIIFSLWLQRKQKPEFEGASDA